VEGLELLLAEPVEVLLLRKILEEGIGFSSASNSGSIAPVAGAVST
jgi:hypothetical protein